MCVYSYVYLSYYIMQVTESYVQGYFFFSDFAQDSTWWNEK